MVNAAPLPIGAPLPMAAPLPTAAPSSVRRDFRMFGSPVAIEVDLAASGDIVGVRALRANDENRKLIQGIDQKIKAGRDVVEQQWAISALYDLVNTLVAIRFPAVAQ